MPEANVLDVAHEAIPYEDIVCAAVFEPSGPAQGPAPESAVEPEAVPRWSLLAVTPTKVCVFSVRSIVPYAIVARPRLFAVLERATTVAHARTEESTTLVLGDKKTGLEYRFECPTGGADYVIKELDANG